MTKRLIGWILIIASLGMVIPTSAATYNASNASQLISSITLANKFAGADIIDLGGNTIIIGAQLPTITSEITIRNGVIDGNNGNYRALEVTSAGDLSLISITIQNFGSGGFNGNGGGVYAAGALSVTNSDFINNHANIGGAIYTVSSSTIMFTDFRNNNADDLFDGGGAIYAEGNLSVEGGVFFNNRAENGGAIEAERDLTIDSTTFTSNQADNIGGAIAISTTVGSLMVRQSSFESNQALSSGGAISVRNADAAAIIDLSDFEANDAPQGSAIIAFSSTVTVQSSRFSAHNALDSQGIIAAFDADITILSSLFMQNTMPILNLASLVFTSRTEVFNATMVDNQLIVSSRTDFSISELFISNSILWNNAGIYSETDNTYQDNLDIEWSLVEGGYAGTGNFEEDPQFADPTNGDFTPIAGSPVIDRSDLNDASNLFAVTTDVAGKDRFVEDTGIANSNGSRLDLGALEFQGTTQYSVAVEATIDRAYESPLTNGELTVSLSRRNRTGSDITANYQQSGGEALSSDYETLAGTAVIPDGEQSVTIPIVPIPDAKAEFAEDLVIVINNVSGAQAFLSTSVSATVTIYDDDVLSPVDALFIINRFGTTDLRADIDGDGFVNANDLQLVMDNLGNAP